MTQMVPKTALFLCMLPSSSSCHHLLILRWIPASSTTMCSEHVEEKKKLYLTCFFHLSSWTLNFSETQQSLQWGMGPPQPLIPQCRRWSAGNLLGLKWCAHVLRQWDVVIWECLLDGFKNTLEKLRPIPFSQIKNWGILVVFEEGAEMASWHGLPQVFWSGLCILNFCAMWSRANLANEENKKENIMAKNLGQEGS